MENKIIGYLMILGGVILILYTAFNVYNVFTKKVEPIKIVSETSLFMPQSIDKGSLVGSMNIDMKEISYISNLAFTIVLAGFFLNVGYKLSLIGASLVRPVVVDIKTKTEKT